MVESHLVLVIIDEKRKIYYVERQTFCAMSEQAKQAQLEEIELLTKANKEGYEIVEMNNKIEFEQSSEVELVEQSRS